MNILAKFNTFQGLENQFHNSIFFQYLAVLKFNSAWEPLLQLVFIYLFEKAQITNPLILESILIAFTISE